MADIHVLGLTGPTGAGKGEVARLLRAKSGVCIIDADVIARDVVSVGTPALAALVSHFSTDILQADGSLDRRRLAALAFASPEQTAALNAIVHPAVIAEIRAQVAAAAQNGTQVAVIDAPLLFQASLDAMCDRTVAVVAPPALRRARICLRDGLSTEEADRRMNAQPSNDYYTQRAHHTLHNTGDLAALETAVDALCEQLEGVFA